MSHYSYRRQLVFMIVVMIKCMYKNLFRATAYSLRCRDGAMIDYRFYSTSRSLTVNRTETVTRLSHEYELTWYESTTHE